MTAQRIAAAITVSLALTGPALADYYLDCSSGGYRYTYCPADTRFGVEISEQKSTTPCTLGSTWGYDAGGVWVDGGCRGTFRILEGRNAPSRYDEPTSDVDTILAEVISDGTMAELQSDDELQGRAPGYSSADAVEACALAADAREAERGAASIYFESVDQVVPRARRAFDIDVTLVVEFDNGRARRFDGECRVQNGRVTAYSRH